jgi:hypothetical protein
MPLHMLQTIHARSEVESADDGIAQRVALESPSA